MDISFLYEHISVVVMGICLCIGFVIKKSLDFIPNKYIPLIMLVLGTLINVAVNIKSIDLGVILTGMLSGLSSTGCYEAFRNLINKNDKENSDE